AGYFAHTALFIEGEWQHHKFAVQIAANVCHRIFAYLRKKVYSEKGEDTLEKNDSKKAESDHVDVFEKPVGIAGRGIDQLAGEQREDHERQAGKYQEAETNQELKLIR